MRLTKKEAGKFFGEARPRKYRNVPVEVEGVKFHSKKEARRYGELRLLEQAGEICHLRLQPKFTLSINGQKICNYFGDFEYYDCRLRRQVIEDTKGFRTREYKLKLKLMFAINGIRVVET